MSNEVRDDSTRLPTREECFREAANIHIAARLRIRAEAGAAAAPMIDDGEAM